MIEILQIFVVAAIFLAVIMFFVIMIQRATIKDLKDKIIYEKAKNKPRPTPPPSPPRGAGVTTNVSDTPIQGNAVSCVPPNTVNLPDGYVWAAIPYTPGNSK